MLVRFVGRRIGRTARLTAESVCPTPMLKACRHAGQASSPDNSDPAEFCDLPDFFTEDKQRKKLVLFTICILNFCSPSERAYRGTQRAIALSRGHATQASQ